jgi:G:T/U-mismatch repair DNA glycosylase
MLREIWQEDLTVVFVETAVTELSGRLGFYHLDPRDRFWALLEMSALTPKRMLTSEENKALATGHRDGSLSDPVRLMFIEKKTSQLLKLGIGLTHLNRRMVAVNEKDKSARPVADDIKDFIARANELTPRILAFVTRPEIIVGSFKDRFPEAGETIGLQPFLLGASEVWLLGSTTGSPRGEALSNQEDAFIALGDRVQSLRSGSSTA